MSALVAVLSTTFAFLAGDPEPRHEPPMREAVASFYGYGPGATGACGTLYPNGLANRTLPCGTRLVVCARRCVRAVVDDRGPYVWGRDFDLSTSLAGAVGFDFVRGVQTIRWRLA